jgi:hypothetical protein
MEILINIKFTSPEQDADFWEQLFAGLCDEKRGAWLEEQFEYFGEVAANAITELMDDCEKNYNTVVFETYERKGNQLETCLNGGWGLFKCLPKIRNLLLLCNVQDLQIDDPDQAC